ncbi:MAG TPA: hypothetical protein V6D10_17695 [Trichocoleus sp.]|jgi:hypothetical protein
MKYQLKLNLNNIKVDQSAIFTWDSPAAAAHEGITLNDGQQLPGYQWIDVTHQQVNLPEVMGEQISTSKTLQEAFNKTARHLAQQYQEALQQAPADLPWDYGAIAASQQLLIE